MFTSLQKLTVIFLVIVQFIAPLVHAHAGENFGLLADAGYIHIPGLERYNLDHKPSTEAQYCGVALGDFDRDGVLVGINLGIKERQFITTIALDNFQLIHRLVLVSNPPTLILEHQTSPSSQRFISRLLSPSLLPRAPPAI